MNSSNIITIGTALKWRGIYNNEKTYYKDNIVSCAGSVFRCSASRVQGQAPVEEADEDGHLSFINTDKWEVVLDMASHYNQIISALQSNDAVLKDIDSLKQWRDGLKLPYFALLDMPGSNGVISYQSHPNTYEALCSLAKAFNDGRQIDGFVYIYGSKHQIVSCHLLNGLIHIVLEQISYYKTGKQLNYNQSLLSFTDVKDDWSASINITFNNYHLTYAVSGENQKLNLNDIAALTSDNATAVDSIRDAITPQAALAISCTDGSEFSIPLVQGLEPQSQPEYYYYADGQECTVGAWDDIATGTEDGSDL